MNGITVVGLGNGGMQLVTLQTAEQLRSAPTLILRTAAHDAAAWLTRQNIVFTALDSLHETAEDFDELNRLCCQAVLEAAEQAPVTYACFDPLHDDTVQALLQSGAPVIILPYVGQDNVARVAAQQAGACVVTTASDLQAQDGQLPLVVLELDNAMLAGEVKMKLLPLYGEQARVLFFEDGKNKGVKPLPLVELDRQKRFGHRAMAVVLPQALLEKERFDVYDLLAVMRILRGENGCPWDRKQTHQSLRAGLIEEAYEAAMAIDEGDDAAMTDELGDVLLQVALHSVIGEEYATTSFSDICTAVTAKMIHRHPHVFGEEVCRTADDVLSAWHERKAKERGIQTLAGEMRDVKKGLAPLLRAAKVQDRAARVGFDWPTALDALDKVKEEAEELADAIRNRTNVAEEMGDLLFSCINVARLLSLDGDKMVALATEKFIKRFEIMENAINSDGKALKNLTIDELSVYWDRSKCN